MSRQSGFVYVMTAPGWQGVKIGRSQYAPHFRAKELKREEYGALGTWKVVDYREVQDPVETEALLHRHFAESWHSFGRTRELFSVSPDEAASKLAQFASTRLTRADQVGQLREKDGLRAYLARLMHETRLSQALDLQEAWVLTLFNRTSGRRWFTISIDRHEVAFSSPREGGKSRFMLFVEPRCLQRHHIWPWLLRRRGLVWRLPFYRSVLDRGAAIAWTSTFEDALGIFEIPMMRRALIAYWHDCLFALRDSGARSIHARHHNHNAVQEILAPQLQDQT